MGDFPAPTEYFGLDVGLVDRPTTGDRGSSDRWFSLSVGNRKSEPWSGRIPIVWVQGGVTWAEALDVALGPSESRRVDLATRWTAGAPPLECRLATERSPRELLSLPQGETEAWAMTSRYLPLGTVATSSFPAPIAAEDDRRDRIRQTVWLVIAAVIAIVAVILLVVYAASIL